MARAKFIDSDDFVMAISRATTEYPEIAEKCLKAGADIIADEMKRRLKGVLLPESRNGELVAAFGISPVLRDRNGNWNAHLGFDGYQETASGRVPFQLIARSFESGAVIGTRNEVNMGKRQKKLRNKSEWKYWRKPTPFAAPAVRATRQKALKVMEDIAYAELEKRTKKQ